MTGTPAITTDHTDTLAADLAASASLLALETSGASLGVALISDGRVCFEENSVEGMIHGRGLAPLMKKALDSTGLRPSQLAGVAVSIGPGSWTGLRIGISAAKTFAWAAKIPLLGVPSFEALALEAKESAQTELVLTLRDARSEGFFTALFDVTGTEPKRLIEECVLKPVELIETIKKNPAVLGGARVSICGDEKCLTLLAAEYAANGWKVLASLQHIPARALAQRAWARWSKGQDVLKSADEIHKLGPLYLRASDPELKLKSKLCP